MKSHYFSHKRACRSSSETNRKLRNVADKQVHRPETIGDLVTFTKRAALISPFGVAARKRARASPREPRQRDSRRDARDETHGAPGLGQPPDTGGMSATTSPGASFRSDETNSSPTAKRTLPSTPRKAGRDASRKATSRPTFSTFSGSSIRSDSTPIRSRIAAKYSTSIGLFALTVYGFARGSAREVYALP